jgi:hypothetical protein
MSNVISRNNDLKFLVISVIGDNYAKITQQNDARQERPRESYGCRGNA